jgi:hypothetical protein
MLLQKSNVLALISITYIVWWLVTFFTWISPLVNASEFVILEGGIYFDALTPLQATAIILFITVGGLAAMGATWFALLKIGNNISTRLATYWEKQKIPIENLPTYQATPYPEEKTYPLEIVETIIRITNSVKAHPLKTGIPLILLGPIMWEAFNINAKIQAPIIGQFNMFQILKIAILVLSVLSTVAGAIIIINHFYKKVKK